MDRPTKELVDVCLKHASADNFKVRFTAVDNCGTEYEASANLAPVLAAEVRALREELAEARRSTGEVAQAAATLQRNVDSIAHNMVLAQRDKLREELAEANAQLEKPLMLELKQLRSTIARVEALPAFWRTLDVSGCTKLEDEGRWRLDRCADDLDLALRGGQ